MLVEQRDGGIDENSVNDVKSLLALKEKMKESCCCYQLLT